MKLYNSLEVARQSVKNDKMMSAYMSEFVSFNVLDKDYVEAKQKELESGVSVEEVFVDVNDNAEEEEEEEEEEELVVPEKP